MVVYGDGYATILLWIVISQYRVIIISLCHNQNSLKEDPFSQ